MTGPLFESVFTIQGNSLSSASSFPLTILGSLPKSFLFPHLHPEGGGGELPEQDTEHFNPDASVLLFVLKYTVKDSGPDN